jgi:transposase-like protein
MRTPRSPETFHEAILLFAEDAVCQAFVRECRWSAGVVRCPYCGSDKVTYLDRVRRFKCYTGHPKAQFSLKVGTLFEDSAVGFNKWLPALWLLTTGGSRMSSHEVARTLGVTQKTAWSMLTRLQRALSTAPAGRHVAVQADAMDPFRAGLRHALAVSKPVSRGTRTPRSPGAYRRR